MDKNKSKIISALYPELAPQIKQQETNDLLKSLIENMQEMKDTKVIPVLKGDKGEMGDRGSSFLGCVDLFTDLPDVRDINEGDSMYVRDNGVLYINSALQWEIVDKLRGENGYTPIAGVDFEVPDGDQIYNRVVDQVVSKFPSEEEIYGRLLKEIPEAIKGEDGKDGELPDPMEIVNGLNTLEGVLETKILKGSFTIEDVVSNIKKNKSLELRDIKGARLDMNDQRWHGGGISNITGLIQAGANITITGTGTTADPYIIIGMGGGSSYTILTATGTINDSNLDFTFASLPTELVINGGSYIQTGGSTTWTWNAGTLTASISTPVGTGGSIYGRA